MIPETMRAVQLIGHGDTDKLVFSDTVAVPAINSDEVLIKVYASAVNNTDINTRLAWYSKSVRDATNATAEQSHDSASAADGSWSGKPLEFPLIQGADCCGEIVAVGANVSGSRVGERVIVRALQQRQSRQQFSGAVPINDTLQETYTYGSECDGGFAEYTKTLSHHALKVESNWSDQELASIPCAYSTAEGMLTRANVGAERVLITGASGGVGAAAVQLAKCRGAHVTAQTSAAKVDLIKEIGADDVILRDDVPEANAFDVVIDLVAGPKWPSLIDSLRGQGRYVVAGAIAGPIVELDVRTLYLKDLTFYGSTLQDDSILPAVIQRIENNELTPLVAAIFPLERLVDAQVEFLSKRHVGKIVVEITGS